MGRPRLWGAKFAQEGVASSGKRKSRGGGGVRRDSVARGADRGSRWEDSRSQIKVKTAPHRRWPLVGKGPSRGLDRPRSVQCEETRKPRSATARQGTEGRRPPQKNVRREEKKRKNNTKQADFGVD